MPAFRGHFSVQGSAVGGLSYKVKKADRFALPLSQSTGTIRFSLIYTLLTIRSPRYLQA